jgi:hypothetical protein
LQNPGFNPQHGKKVKIKNKKGKDFQITLKIKSIYYSFRDHGFWGYFWQYLEFELKASQLLAGTLPLQPLYKLFFALGIFVIGFRELFSQAGLYL